MPSHNARSRRHEVSLLAVACGLAIGIGIPLHGVRQAGLVFASRAVRKGIAVANEHRQ